jgi:hypothetical protein
LRNRTTVIYAAAGYWLAFLACAGIAFAGLALAGGPQDPGSAAALRAKHDEIRDKLEKNQFGRPLYLVSSETSNHLKGDVYAVVNHPFARVASAFSDPAGWCDVLILPFNTKHCHATGGAGAKVLAVRVGRKAGQPAEEAYPIEFKYRETARTEDYFRTVLKADSGPLGTHDYQIVLEATPLDEKRTSIHLSYSYGFGVMSRLAMQAYLSTVGASKVGFTVLGKDEQGRPRLVGGMLGATERNTMRYFLAIDSYLASLDAPRENQVEKRLNDWFAATEKYPRQLHEMDRAEYIAMKQKETKRLHAAL